SVWTKDWLTCSGGKGARSCRGWPSWPPILRRPPSSGGAGLGLTMSEEGGLDEVVESLPAAASCSRTEAISTRKASYFSCKALTRCWSFWQLAHGWVGLGLMPLL